MLLCDIGNTSYHFYDTVTAEESKKDVEAFDPSTIVEKVYYINVKTSIQDSLDGLGSWTDLRPFVEWERYYATMGIDRVMACEAVENGLVVDAGSAVTVDVVRSGTFEGGFILPGVRALEEAYARISPKLACSFNFDVRLDKMPKNTRDAISYGALGLLAKEVEGYGLPVYLTGGDASALTPLFAQASHAPLLLFAGMEKIIQKAGLC